MKTEAGDWTSSGLAALFAYAHSLFRPPSPEQHTWLRSEECQSGWLELVAEFGSLKSRLEVPSDFDDYAERFIATFDVGTPNPPVPLIESHYNKRDPIPRILHENILFYRQFGLQLRDSALESADHLRHQLEFVRHLLEYESQLENSGQPDKKSQVTLAIADYSKRHLSSWLPEAIRCVDDPPLPYANAALILCSNLADLAAQSVNAGGCRAHAVDSTEGSQCLA